MLEGHQKGRDDLYRQQRNIFETNQKQLDKKIDDLFKFMQENTKLYARDKVAAEQNANAKFAEEGAGFLKTYYEKYGPGPALEYMKQIVKAKEHAADLTDKEKTRAENERFRLQQADIQAEAKKEAQKSSYEYVTKDGKTYAINKNNPKDIQEVNVDLGGATKVGVQPKGGAGSSQQQFENITSADIGNAYFRINELLKESKDNKIPEGSKFLRDKGVQSGVIDAYKNWLVNRSLPPDLQQTDAALLGMAFDVVAARSFGRSAGVTDAKIAQVVRQLPVEGDSESTKQSKMRMLLNQLEEPNKLLPKEKRKDGAEYMTSPISQSLYSSYAGTSKSEKDPVTGYPKFNDKGWELHSDSQGGYAYVSPNGKDYEEIE
jgi:hypothetical protein